MESIGLMICVTMIILGICLLTAFIIWTDFKDKKEGEK